MAFVLVPALLILCVLAVIALWPRFNNGNTVDSQATDDGPTTSSIDTSAELYATHAGGTTDSELADDTESSMIDGPKVQPGDEAPTTEPDAEPIGDRPRPAAVPAPPPPVSRLEPAQPQTGNQLPQQLRGPGQVNPAQGGATWILASGNRTSAEELAEGYRRRGYRSSVLAGEANGLTVHRVAVGQFANAEEARGLRSRLPSDAPADTWVLNF